MKTIFENNFVVIQFDEEIKLISSFWTDNTQEMDEEDLRIAITAFANLIDEYTPSLLFSDDSKCECVNPVGMQKWIAETIGMAAIRAGVTKYALILPHDLVSSISQEQTVEEAVDLPFELSYFEDAESAKKWLLE